MRQIRAAVQVLASEEGGTETRAGSGEVGLWQARRGNREEKYERGAKVEVGSSAGFILDVGHAEP